MKPNTTSEDMLELLNMSRKQFIEVNKGYLESIGQTYFDLTDKNGIIQPLKCPLHLWSVHNKTKCVEELVSNTASCPLCDNPICPVCANHHVDQLSRVTGYMAPVSGYNAGKKQEFKDRQRHSV